ncbi:MAG: DUF1559 domain-containing protein [Planctomycetes bacterium]|nr:DUF1559 domain-containing protein [Planctomycetota bacterium]
MLPDSASRVISNNLALIVTFAVIAFSGLWLLLPAVQQAREAVHYAPSCYMNVKFAALALHNYHSDYGSLPPAVIRDEFGKPMHSWRALLLPYQEITKITISPSRGILLQTSRLQERTVTTAF